VDGDGRPQGWVPQNRRAAIRTVADLVPGGSLYRRGDTLRRALDAALSAPSGLGVTVDEDGRAVGVVRAGEILELIEDARVARGRANHDTAV
jgi:osmoprotectant transport system ATP-binding protein